MIRFKGTATLVVLNTESSRALWDINLFAVLVSKCVIN